jgi:hypothetical protein
MSSGSAASRAASLLLAGVVLGLPAEAAVDLAKLQVTPQRGQSADQVRRDRYECHNWAVAQTGGQVPSAAPPPNQSSGPDKAKRADMIYRIMSGAAIGASIGGIASAIQNEYAGEAVLAGAAIGGAVGAGTGAAKHKKEEKAAAEGPDDYVRALTACLEGRGYAVAMPN